MWIERDGAEVSGGYEYAVQRLDSLRFLTDPAYITDTADSELMAMGSALGFTPTGKWTDNPENALKAETLNGGMNDEFEEAISAVAWWYEPIFREDVDKSEFEGFTEDRAWEFSQHFLKPGLRLVRIPFVNETDLADLEDSVFVDQFDTIEEYEAYRKEHPSRFYNIVDSFDYAKLRNEVFGLDAAIAASGEIVPPEAPWSACDAKELKERFGLPEWA